MSNLYHDAGPPSAGRKVFLATTAYESPDASYTYSIQSSRQALAFEGIESAYSLLSGNCHVDDARNSMVQEFLLSDCDDMVFLDADVSWNPEDLVKLCQRDKDLVGGVYSYRREDMLRTGTMPVQLIDLEPDENGLLEVKGLPTGFMRIKRCVFEALDARAKKHWGRSDKRSQVAIFFEREMIDGEWWSGDLNFCRKWREAGGKIHADAELSLGHIAKTRIVDSLAATLRRAQGTSLRHCVDLIRNNKETPDTYREAITAVDNPWAVSSEVLAVSTLLARQSKGPILEMGSGISTILMAAATKEQVWCVEHSEYFASRLEDMARAAGVGNIALVTCSIKDRWYDLSEDMNALPEMFDLALIDGPPRSLSDRMPFFETFGHRVGKIVCDDADETAYVEKIRAWAKANNRNLHLEGGRLAIIMEESKDG